VDLLVGVVGRKQVIHAGLRHSAVPAQRADRVHAHLAGHDDDVAGVDHRLQHAHRTVVEEEGIVVVGRAAEQFDVVGAVGEARLRDHATSELACCTPTLKLSKVA
jgi:hypothetical protein